MSTLDKTVLPGTAVMVIGDQTRFEVVENRVRLRSIEIGARNTFDAEVRSGLHVGAVVISYPSNDVADGARVVALPKRLGP